MNNEDKKILKEIIDFADDLIFYHVDKFHQRKWREFCKEKGYKFNKPIRDKKIEIELIDIFQLLAENGSTYDIDEFCSKYNVSRQDYQDWWDSIP